MTEETSNHKYICAEGHTIDLKNGKEFYMAIIDSGDGRGGVGYRYCPHCFGKWATMNFPLKELN